MASTPSRKQQRPEDGSGPDPKRLRPSHSAPAPRLSHRVELNPADCNLDFDVGSDSLQGSALYENGFAYCWSGARATVGISRGKYCFGYKIISEQQVDMEDTPSDQQHVARVGISRGDDPVGSLGESDHSFGYGGTGKFSNAGCFSGYGTKFSVGDTIVCAVNLENGHRASIGFSKNGQWLGIAKQFEAGSQGHGGVDISRKERAWESAFFPHILLKNVVAQMQFSSEDGLVPEEGYRPWSSAVEDGNAITGPSFLSMKELEVLMMVGLPASGKTTWAEKWMKEHPEKRYIILGTNLALEQMKVPGLLRKHNYGERFERLMGRATEIFNTLLHRAAKTPRNYILDQTNVYKNARKRKLNEFAEYRKIAVVVFPMPEELKLRAHKRFQEMGKEVPPEAVNEMLANYVLPMGKDMPCADEPFDLVMFVELNRAEAQRCLTEMKNALPLSADRKSDVSSYSRGSSIQSFARSPRVSADSWRHQTPPNHFLDTPPQAGRPYCSSGLYGTPQYSPCGSNVRSGEPRTPMLNSSHYEYHGYGSTARPGLASNSYGRYVEDDSYSRPSLGSHSFTREEPPPYQLYRVDDACRTPNLQNLEIPSSLSTINSQYSRTPIPSYTRPGAQFASPIIPLADHEAVGSLRDQSYGSYPVTASYSSSFTQSGDSRVHQMNSPASREILYGNVSHFSDAQGSYSTPLPPHRNQVYHPPMSGPRYRRAH